MKYKLLIISSLISSMLIGSVVYKQRQLSQAEHHGKLFLKKDGCLKATAVGIKLISQADKLSACQTETITYVGFINEPFLKVKTAKGIIEFKEEEFAGAEFE